MFSSAIRRSQRLTVQALWFPPWQTVPLYGTKTDGTIEASASHAQAVLSSSLVRWNWLSSPRNSSTEDQPVSTQEGAAPQGHQETSDQMMHTHTQPPYAYAPLLMHTHNPRMHTHYSLCTHTTPVCTQHSICTHTMHMHTHHSIRMHTQPIRIHTTPYAHTQTRICIHMHVHQYTHIIIPFHTCTLHL